MSHTKVCHLTTVHPAFDNRILEKECVSLAEAGYEVVLLAPNCEEQVYKGVQIRSLQIPRNRLLRMTAGTLRMLFSSLRQKADIYHFHDPELMPAGLILRLMGKMVIADVHENYPASILSKPYLNKAVATLLSKLFRVIELFFLSRMNAIVTATSGISNSFMRFKPITIHNFPIIPDLESITTATVPGNKPGAIYVGGLSQIRGIIPLINAFGELEEIELWLLGPFESESFKMQCESLPAWRNVRYLGVSNPAGVYPYLKAASIGIATLLPFPNYKTALATKSFEYMAAGLPVVMSDFPYWKEYFGDSAIYVNPADPTEIANAIRSLLSNRELMEQMSSSNIAKSRYQFRWEGEAEKLVTMYRNLTDRKPK
jgi:glycosyltransferase involved in cell wall biosynthesis